MSTCIVSFVIGLVLLTAGLYGRVGSGAEVAELEEHRHGTHVHPDGTTHRAGALGVAHAEPVRSLTLHSGRSGPGPGQPTPARKLATFAWYASGSAFQDRVPPTGGLDQRHDARSRGGDEVEGRSVGHGLVVGVHKHQRGYGQLRRVRRPSTSRR